MLLIHGVNENVLQPHTAHCTLYIEIMYIQSHDKIWDTACCIDNALGIMVWEKDSQERI